MTDTENDQLHYVLRYLKRLAKHHADAEQSPQDCASLKVAARAFAIAYADAAGMLEIALDPTATGREYLDG